MPLTNVTNKVASHNNTAELLHAWSSLAGVLKENSKNNYVATSSAVANSFKGDFFGLLLSMGIGPEFHFPHLLVNGLKTSTDYDGITTSIQIIDESILSSFSKFLNIKKKIK